METYVELPALEMLAGVFAGYHHHELGDLAPDHPLVELRHDLLDVRFDLVVRGDQHGEAIFLDSVYCELLFQCGEGGLQTL